MPDMYMTGTAQSRLMKNFTIEFPVDLYHQNTSDMHETAKLVL